MDTSGPLEDQPQVREEEPMDMDPCPKPQPTASTPVSQNSPGFILEKSLSVPSQPEFSHVSVTLYTTLVLSSHCFVHTVLFFYVGCVYFHSKP